MTWVVDGWHLVIAVVLVLARSHIPLALFQDTKSTTRDPLAIGGGGITLELIGRSGQSGTHGMIKLQRLWTDGCAIQH